MLLWTCYYKHIFLETMFLKPLNKIHILIIWLIWNVKCMFELSVVTAWTKDFMMTRIGFFNLQWENIEISTKNLFSLQRRHYYFSFLLVHAVKKPLLIVKKFWFSVLALLESKFSRRRLRKFWHIVLHFRYRSILDIISKQQIRKVYIKVSIKKISNYYTLWFPFSYKSLLKNTQFYVF